MPVLTVRVDSSVHYYTLWRSCAVCMCVRIWICVRAAQFETEKWKEINFLVVIESISTRTLSVPLIASFYDVVPLPPDKCQSTAITLADDLSLACSNAKWKGWVVYSKYILLLHLSFKSTASSCVSAGYYWRWPMTWLRHRQTAKRNLHTHGCGKALRWTLNKTHAPRCCHAGGSVNGGI